MSRVRYGQSGYSGLSRSNRAVEAESNDRLPMTRAVAAIRKRAGCTARQAREACAAVGAAEWHHVGKYAARVNYYDVGAACNWLAAKDAIARLPGDARERFRRKEATLADLAREADTDERTVERFLYRDWTGE